MNRLVTIVLLVGMGLASPLHAESADVVTIQSLLREMVDRDSVARFPQHDFRLKQHSSYNRASTTHDDERGWFNNKDNNTSEKDKNFIRIEETDGHKEWVLMEDEGAGVIVRSWMPWRGQRNPETNSVIRFYLDGSPVPAIEGNMFEMFQGKGLIPFPLAHSSLRSAVSFFPIPYAKSCKVTVSELPFFYQFTYREYADGTPVRTFTMDDFNSAAPLIEKTCETLLDAGSESHQEFRAADKPKLLASSATVEAGGEHAVDLPAGEAAIRTLAVKLGSYEDESVTRTVVLKIEFDDKETVWCPVGDLFGTGIGLHPFQDWYRSVAEDGTMTCRWTMPYRESARVSVVNLSNKAVDVSLQCTVGDWKWDDRSLYFYAAWRGQFPVATRPYSDWNYVTLQGRGVYVGDTLTIMNPVEKWWGEGDEKIFVDGESFPSIFGTGTEDYYAYSWGGISTDFYEHPFHAQPRSHRYDKLHRKIDANEKNTQGYSTETRTRSLDTMPFSTSLKLDMEVWSWADCDMGYGVGVYWYGDAETTSNRNPDPAGALAVPPHPNPKPNADLSRSETRQEFRRKSVQPKVLTTSATTKQPNIVLLISDDDDYEHFGFMGDKVAHTPTLDALANSGTLFTTGYCPAPLCRPSLASMLSGRLPHQHGIYANYLENNKIGGDKTKLDPKGSLANRLKDAGYATYATAKYWEGDPRAMGFTHGTVKTTFQGFGQFVRNDQDELNRFIEDQGQNNPMFIWWAPLLPHKPHNPPATYFDRFADAEIPIPSFYKGDPKAYVSALRKFYAMGTWFDDGVAQLIDKLKESGEYENTIFLFYVDNGYAFGVPAKNSPTEKGLRTPMFVSWPGRPGSVPSKRLDDPSYALDLHATVLDYAGIPLPTDIASQSLRPLIEGKTTKPHDVIFGAVYAHAPAAYFGDPWIKRSPQRDVYALYARTKQWKYVLYTQDINNKNDRYIWMVHELCDALTRHKGDENLFDLDADPYEQNNLAGQPEQNNLRADFRNQVLNWWTETGGRPLELVANTASIDEPTALAVGYSTNVADELRPEAIANGSQETRNPPNFIVIFTDDQGYQDVGCFGSPDIRTPRLDAMANEGMKFTSFYAQPICGPSRAALMTGCYPMRVAERGTVKQVHPVLHENEITVAEVLKAKGYATGCYGKWDLAMHSQTNFFIDLFPTRQGFDEFFGTPTSNDSIVNLYRNEELIEPKTDMATLTRRYTDEAIDFISRHRDQPFFVYIPHSMPHTRLDASNEFKGKSNRGLYGDVIEEIDFNVGRIVDSVRELGLAENTYVLFTSDNGPWLSKNKNFADGHLRSDHGGSAGPLRSGKVSTFEGGVRVPTILWGPGHVPAGTTCEKIASTLDVLPTFAALAGTQPPTDRVIDGEDIRHLFRGEFAQANPKKTYFYYLRMQLQAVRQGKWKLHLPRDKEPIGAAPFSKNTHIAPSDRSGFDTPFLFDLDNDIGETTNVADRNPEVVTQLLALAEAMRDDLGDYDRVGQNMRFFDLTGARPTTPPVPQVTNRGQRRVKTGKQ